MFYDRILKSAVTGVMFIGLMACGGGSTSGNSDASFDELAKRADVLTRRFDDISATPVANVPTSGSTQYSGVFAAESNVAGETTGIAGVVEIDVNFAKDRFSGVIDNLRDSSNARFGGNLNLVDGSLDRSRAEVIGESKVSGAITGPEGERIIVDGASILGFGGTTYGAIAGLVGGDVSVDGADGTFIGAIVAER